MATTMEDIVQNIVIETIDGGDTEACTVDTAREIAREEICDTPDEDKVREIVQEELSDRLSGALDELDHQTSDDVISRIENHESDEPHLSADDIQKVIDARLDRICGTIADALAERLRQQLVAFMREALGDDNE